MGYCVNVNTKNFNFNKNNPENIVCVIKDEIVNKKL